jgi:hypothetical protein
VLLQMARSRYDIFFIFPRNQHVDIFSQLASVIMMQLIRSFFSTEIVKQKYRKMSGWKKIKNGAQAPFHIEEN